MKGRLLEQVLSLYNNKNSSGDEVVNEYLYAVRPEATRIR